jgi:hypothetical protein
MPCGCQKRKAAMVKWLEQRKQRRLANLVRKLPTPGEPVVDDASGITIDGRRIVGTEPADPRISQSGH